MHILKVIPKVEREHKHILSQDEITFVVGINTIYIDSAQKYVLILKGVNEIKKSNELNRNPNFLSIGMKKRNMKT